MAGELSEANRAIFLKAKVGITDVLPAFRHFANPLGVLNQIMDPCRSEGPHPDHVPRAEKMVPHPESGAALSQREGE